MLKENTLISMFKHVCRRTIPIKEENKLCVFVKTLRGCTITVWLKPSHSIYLFKHIIQDREDVLIDQQILNFNGKQLEDGLSLKRYGLKNKDTVHMQLRLRGGREHFASILQYLPIPNEALQSIDELYRKRMHCGYQKRPLVLLFTGVGIGDQAFFAQKLASYSQCLYEGGKLIENTPPLKDNFIRYDMNDYNLESQVRNFADAVESSLISKISNCPNMVVLFEQTEQAHPDIFKIFDMILYQSAIYQCHDSTIFIMTSSVAHEQIVNYRESKLQNIVYHHESVIDANFKTDTILPLLRRQFKRSGFIDRIDKLVCFLPLTRGEIENVVKSEITKLDNDLQAKRKNSSGRIFEYPIVALNSLSKNVSDFLYSKYLVEYESRNVIYQIKLQVVDKLINDIDNCTVSEGATIELCMNSHETLDYWIWYDDFDDNVR